MTAADRGRDFALLAYNVIVGEKRFAAKAVALAMDMSYDALHARLSNKTPFAADEIRRLIRAAPDPRLVAWLLRGTRFVPAERLPKETIDKARDAEIIHLAATRTVLEAADVLEAVEVALCDHRIDHKEALQIRDEIEAAERALASLSELR